MNVLNHISSQRNKIISVIVILVVLASLIIHFSDMNALYFNFIFEKDLTKAIDMQAEWILNNQRPRGDIAYTINTKTGKPVNGNHIVRQTAIFYNLALYYKMKKDPKIKDSIEKGLDFFQQNSQQSEVKLNGETIPVQRFIFDDQRYNNANALLLLALINYIEANPQASDKYLLFARHLANYLLYTQQPNGGYMYKDDPTVQDDYNNGESMYALIRMYQIDKNPLYLEAAKKSGDYFISNYGSKEIIFPFYSWSMQAFYYMYQVEPNEKYWQFIKNYTEKYMSSEGRTAEEFYYGQGSVSPSNATTVFLEGITHVGGLAKIKDPQLYLRLKKYTEYSLRYLFNYQINGPYSLRHSPYKQVSGGVCFDYLCKQIRVDSVGHNLSSIYFYFSLMK